MIRSLKKSTWLLVLILTFMALVYYRAFIFNSEFNKPVDTVVNDVSDFIEIEIPSYELAENDSSLQSKLFGEAKIDKAEVAQPAIANDSMLEVDQDADVANESESDLDMDKIVEVVEDAVNETLKIFMEENEQQASQSTVDKSSALTASELLFKARLSYWNGDLKTAENTYLQLTELADSDPNVYGELGNLYYMQAKWKKASEAYFHAAVKLKNINQEFQAQHLLRIIRGLDTETANKLQAELYQPS